MDMPVSFIHIHDGRIVNATNDGMEVLGHFLLTQVGTKADFFMKWLKEDQDGEISAGSYFLVKRIGTRPIPRIESQSDTVEIEHLNDERVASLITTRKNMIDILQKWESLCKSASHSACKVGGLGVKIIRSVDGASFTFETQNA